MAVPKRRTSKSAKGHRRSHHFRTMISVQYCPQCNETILPHRVCAKCGFYQGKEVVVMAPDEAPAEGK